MKTRIDKVTIDRDGQYVVHVTHADDNAEFPVAPSGACVVFRTKEEVTAYADGARGKTADEATREAVSKWLVASPEADIAAATGIKSEPVKTRVDGGKL